MAKQGFNWGEVNLEDEAELLLGWRPRPGHIEVGAVELSTSVAIEMANAAKKALKDLAKMNRRPFSEALALEVGEEYVFVPAGNLLIQNEKDPNKWEEPEIVSIVADMGHQALSPEELRDGRYLFYAVIGREVNKDTRVGFIRQVDPHRVERQVFLKTIMGSEGLQKLIQPIFVFEDGFDVVVAPSEIAILRLEPFNRIFADLAPITAAAVPNANIIAGSLGNMTQSAVNTLVEVAASRPSLARRVQRLARPGAMPTFTITELRNAMVKHNLSPNLLINGLNIDFTNDGVIIFLDMVEQLYYETDFTQEHRRADRFSPNP
ncbi:hypothetical protein [Ferrimicrobium sp.]|uniref:hypothetical protein n=1 Tax=Ferrimicrobium sp. TaxID=2926050 RepID=UPI0026351130|nr:hypothetical protein [Ferrimicrobium sp.]